MTDIELMIGQSSTEAERKRAARLANKALPPPRTNGGHLSDIRPPEIEIKKEIDIEIEKERELETGQAPARSYGRYNNVFLSDTELDELKAELPDKWEYYIDRLSTHIASKGTKYRSHAAVSYTHLDVYKRQAMQPRYTSGRRRTKPRNRRKKAYPITPLRRARVYD